MLAIITIIIIPESISPFLSPFSPAKNLPAPSCRNCCVLVTLSEVDKVIPAHGLKIPLCPDNHVCLVTLVP